MSEFIGAAKIINVNAVPTRLVFYGNAKAMLFTIHPDGSIERGPSFTTVDEMAQKFWEAVERMRPRAL